MISRPRLDHGGPERVTIAPSGPYKMITVSYSDDTFEYHITGHRSLSCTVMIPSGIYSTFGCKQLFPLSTSKVYAGMKHKTNDLNMTCEKI